jgi:hypothetical protein
MSKKIILISLLVLAVAGGTTAWFMYNKPHRNIAGEKPAFSLEAAVLAHEFMLDEEIANTWYLNKVILVTGIVVGKTLGSDGSYTIVLEDEYEGISATFDPAYSTKNREKLEAVTEGEPISLKGRCDGMLMLQGVILNKCVLE